MSDDWPKWVDLYGIDPDFPLADDGCARCADLEAQLRAARDALAAVREVAQKRAGRKW